MRRILFFVAWAALATGAGAGLGEAQTRDDGAPTSQASAQPDGDDDAAGPLARLLRGRLSLHLNAAYRAAPRPYEMTTGFRAYGEEARFLARGEFEGEPLADVGGVLRIWRGLAVGASYGEVHGVAATTVTGTVPHPLDFDRHRMVSPFAVNLPYRERTTHVRLSWRAPLTDTLDVAIFIGPSFLSLRQDVVTHVTATEAGGPPFSDVAVEVHTATHTRNGVGGNAGMEVTYMANSTLGFGYFARYSRGYVEMPAGDGSTRNVEVAGFQTGGGLRVRF